MTNPVWLQKKNGKYLWFTLLGLGFQPDNVAIKINLGPTMFDKPNKDAFYVVTHFLLKKLNPTRFHEAYRYCWPVLNPKADAEFRKVTCAWLREIMDETANAGSRVVASLFLSPGGPKFVSLILHLASHVMLHEMKTFITDDSWVPEVAAAPVSSLDMAQKRLRLIKARFLKAAVEQDQLLQEYQRRAQHIMKCMRDVRAEGTKYDGLLKGYNRDAAQEGMSQAVQIQKVRCLWSAIDGMLSSTKEEQQVVESVLKGDMKQCVLDGTDRVLKVPPSLQKRIEQLPHQLSGGHVYEADQLNLLCVLELANHSFHLLREEHRRVSQNSSLHLSSEQLQDKCQQVARVLQDLRCLRQKIAKGDIPEVRSVIRDLEVEWDKRWMDAIKDTPLMSCLNEDHALDLLSPMAPLSFEPSPETLHKSDVFSLFPARLGEETPAKMTTQEEEPKSNLESSCFEMAESPAAPTEATARPNTSLDWLFDSLPSRCVMTPLPLPSPQAATAVHASVRKTSRAHLKTAPTKCKTQIFELECDNLANQFAEAVMTSPVDSTVKDLGLEDLLCTLRRDPFSAKKQLARTPESLNVKSSWRKAVEENEAEKAKQSDIVKQLTPLDEPQQVQQNPGVAPQQGCSSDTPNMACRRSPPICQQGVLLSCAPLWDISMAESPLSLSDTGISSEVQFSLNHETLPEILSSDSLLSIDNEAADLMTDEDELLTPPVCSPKTQQLPLTTRQCDNVFAGTGEQVLSPRSEVPELDTDWLTKPETSAEAVGKVFTLDLDTLESPSSREKQKYSFPRLLRISLIEDM
ncbi:HAUS augmin-like complex subunit 6 isoform X2 [Thalassophryne amazonica]|uniref:HAUS augmin-like complex subunit 6 isoform X2 n=1 Tax=Thalassophryne amazonica TaxID=390379 RepID=UPI001471F28D|nr:HAUS augmin-like complex subunit 6 isoform X2 [Thalassophryne amazonica]